MFQRIRRWFARRRFAKTIVVGDFGVDDKVAKALKREMAKRVIRQRIEAWAEHHYEWICDAEGVEPYE